MLPFKFNIKDIYTQVAVKTCTVEEEITLAVFIYMQLKTAADDRMFFCHFYIRGIRLVNGVYLKYLDQFDGASVFQLYFVVM